MSEKSAEKESGFDPRIQTEDIAFKPSEMLECAGCGRQNPPNRLNCLYCGKALAGVDAKDVRPDLHKLEPWERGWNVIFAPSADPDLTAIAELLSMSGDHITHVATAGVALPVARVGDEQAAEIICERMKALGAAAAVVSDAQLELTKPPLRLAGVSFSDGEIGLVDFNTGETRKFAPQELEHIVVGTIEKTMVDTVEKRRRGKETKTLDETAMSSDETVIDLYFTGDPIGSRILPHGFDFSCLGNDKGLMAGENMRQLLLKLTAAAPQAKFVDSYSKVRHLLDPVWETESRKDPQGLRRSGFARQEFGTLQTTSNEGQFARYSRLQPHLK